jgi:Flp pilus assembly protein TadD
VTSIGGSKKRELVPRWRSVVDTFAVERSTPWAGPLPPSAEQLALLEERRREWETHGGQSIAAEFVGTARALGRVEDAQSAADFLSSLTDGSGRVPVGYQAIEQLDQIPPRVRRAGTAIRSLRHRLANDPRSAVGWCDLSRSLVVVGKLTDARRAILTAVQLAPSSRYILRSASCCLETLQEPDLALSILRRSEALGSDPWLMSAALAVGRLAGGTPPSARSARAILDDGNWNPRDLSELSAELGTIEMTSSARRARQLFRRSAVDPTENALAQIEWATLVDTGLAIPIDTSHTLNADEAIARKSIQDGTWDSAADSALSWQTDQPFSSEAGIIASSVLSSGLQRFDDGFAAAQDGLRSNPSNLGLLNNAAYSLIELGDAQRARAYLSQIALEEADSRQLAIVSATQGLLSFREGDPERGSSLYEASARIARSANETDIEILGSLMLAREFASTDRSNAAAIFTRAERMARNSRSQLVRRWVEIVRDLIQTPVQAER